MLVDKQRIEEEELKLAAEERYRAEVRAKLRSPARRSTVLFLILGAGVLIVLIVSAIVWSRTGAPATKSSTNSGDTDAAQQAANPSPLTPPVPKTRYVPVDQKIVTGEITLKARRSLQYRVTITPEMLEPILTGSFTASGGHSNDIMAVIADETNYTNWINGHEARSFWSTREKRPAEDLGSSVAGHILSGHQQQDLPVYRQAGAYSSRSELQDGQDLLR